MIYEIISMNGYGAYVWSAFAFTLISFASLYLVTKLQLLKEQKKFIAKFGSLSSEKAKLQNHIESIKKYCQILKYLTYKPCMVKKLNSIFIFSFNFSDSNFVSFPDFTIFKR